MDDRSTAKRASPDDASPVRCPVCEREVPLSEAVVPEAGDYMAYFCGLECYARWRKQAGAFGSTP